MTKIRTSLRDDHRAPAVLTEHEVNTLLATTKNAVNGTRDWILFRIALCTGLRLAELCALNVGDVADGKGIRTRVRVRVETVKGAARIMARRRMKPGSSYYIPISRGLQASIRKYLAQKGAAGEDLAADAPLFCSRGGRGNARGSRISRRGLERAFELRQAAAGFERTVNFHMLRHTAITTWCRTVGLLEAKEIARHASLDTTMIYLHVTESDLEAGAELLPWS